MFNISTPTTREYNGLVIDKQRKSYLLTVTYVDMKEYKNFKGNMSYEIKVIWNN